MEAFGGGFDRELEHGAWYGVYRGSAYAVPGMMRR